MSTRSSSLKFQSAHGRATAVAMVLRVISRSRSLTGLNSASSNPHDWKEASMAGSPAPRSVATVQSGPLGILSPCWLCFLTASNETPVLGPKVSSASCNFITMGGSLLPYNARRTLFSRSWSLGLKNWWKNANSMPMKPTVGRRSRRNFVTSITRSWHGADSVLGMRRGFFPSVGSRVGCVPCGRPGRRSSRPRHR